MNDPIFFCGEVKLLRRLKLEVVSENLECKVKCQVHTSNFNIESFHQMSSNVMQVPTLLFLPHCPKQLTNNLLYTNWSPQSLAKWVEFYSLDFCLIFNLSRLSLISNSFSSTVERGVKSDIERNAPLLSTLVEAEMVEEVVMSNTFRFEDVFNDMALHKFSGMTKAKEGFWDVELPEYSEDAEFIRCPTSR